MPDVMQRSYWTRPLPWLVALAHVATAATLLATIDPDSDFQIVPITLLCAQVSLVAIWGAAAPEPAWLRMPAAILAVFAIWSSFTDHFVRDRASGESVSTLLMFAAQGLLVGTTVVLARVARFVLRRWRAEASAEDSRPLRYGVRTLILWTTSLAALFGVGRIVFDTLGWTDVELSEDDFAMIPLIGGYHALLAAIIVVTMLRRNRRALRTFIGLALAALVGLSFLLMSTLLLDADQQPPQLLILGLGLGQAIVLYATLLPLGWSLFGKPPGAAAESRTAGESPGIAGTEGAEVA